MNHKGILQALGVYSFLIYQLLLFLSQYLQTRAQPYSSGTFLSILT